MIGNEEYLCKQVKTLQAEVEELETTIDTVTKSRDYWKNHWTNAYSELRGIDPAALMNGGRSCKVCGQDYAIAELGESMGFRVDIALLENRRLQAKVKELTAKLKQRDFQDEVLEETGRLLDKSQAKVAELTAELVDGTDHLRWGAEVVAFCEAALKQDGE